MMEIAQDTTHSSGKTTGVTNTEGSEEQPTTGYMEGWALASLSVAFMSICLVLAIDNTILCLCFP